MAFRQEDFKKTSRKGAGDAPAALYPHQLKDKKTLARLEVALRTFDAAVGKRRGDMDAGAMTDFFGDPRLARGVVACLGQFYKYETPDFAQAVGRDAAGRLREAGLGRPVDVRALTYAVVNEQHGGFLPEAARAGCYEALGARFCLSAHQWNLLLHADAEDNQVLTRLGAVPTPADLRALYNFHSLDTVLRRATQIVLSGLALSPNEAADVRALGKALGLRASVSGDGATVTLAEEPALLGPSPQRPTPAGPTPGASADPSLGRKGKDLGEASSPTPPSFLSGTVAPGKGAGGLGLFPRRVGRLSRALLHLLAAYGSRAVTGYADAKIGTRAFRALLGTDALRVLGMPLKAAEVRPQFRRRFEAGAALHKDLLKRRARGQAAGWRIKRLPEPWVTATGVLLPDLALARAGVTLPVVIGSSPGGEDEGVVSLPLGRKPLDADALLARADGEAGSLFALPPAAPLAVPGDVRALCDRAAREGLVRSADARRTLHLLDDSPLIAWVRQCADPRVRFVPGVGLCSRELVSAIQNPVILAEEIGV